MANSVAYLSRSFAKSFDQIIFIVMQTRHTLPILSYRPALSAILHNYRTIATRRGLYFNEISINSEIIWKYINDKQECMPELHSVYVRRITKHNSVVDRISYEFQRYDHPDLCDCAWNERLNMHFSWIADRLETYNFADSRSSGFIFSVDVSRHDACISEDRPR